MTVVAVNAQQTLWVAAGNVRYAYAAEQVGVMTSTDTTLTVKGKTFSLADIDSIFVTATAAPADTLITVTYQDDIAFVDVPNALAQCVDVRVEGAHVSVVQDTTVTAELAYYLTGTTTVGSFYHKGSYKITLALNNVNITNDDGYAIYIDDGKRVMLNLLDGTTNSLADSPDGTHSGCFIVDGHTEIKGAGSLTITGNTKHAFVGDEYLELKKSVGNITVTSAVADAFHINQYVYIKGGVVTVESCGEDAFQIDKKKDLTKENNGRLMLEGGEIVANVSGNGAKGIKAEGPIIVEGGKITINHSGSFVEGDDDDVKNAVCLRGDSTFTLNAAGCIVTLNATGANGKGLSFDGDILLKRGDLVVTTAGNGIDTEGVVTIAGNRNYVNAGKNGIKAAQGITVTTGYNAFYAAVNPLSVPDTAALKLNGGYTLAVGTAISYPSAQTQCAAIYEGTVTEGEAIALFNNTMRNVIAFVPQRDYGTTPVKALMASNNIKKDIEHSLYRGSTLNTAKANWHQFYYNTGNTTANGTLVGTATAASPYFIIGQ